MRVWNGPGPTSTTSDDRAMDIALDDSPCGDGLRVWLTGHVREADSVGYDAATISYLVNLGPDDPPLPNETLSPNLPATTEKGLALDANGLDVYVTGSIQVYQNLTMMLTFKIKKLSTCPLPPWYDFDWTRLFGMAISDIPSAIIAPTAR